MEQKKDECGGGALLRNHNTFLNTTINHIDDS